MDEDRQLAERLRSGDRDALRRIYRKYKDDLLTAATWILLDTASAEDCLHDVIVGLASNAAMLRVHGSLRSYLVTSVANRARDLLRTRARRPEASPGTLLGLEAGDDEPLVHMIQDEQARLIHRAMAELPVSQRIAITLHLHGGMTFEEIAMQESISNNTARSRYRYGLDKLRSSLGAGVRS